MTPIDAFLTELDRGWDGDDQVTLRVIGSVALMLQAPYARTTKDYDVLEVAELSPETRERLELRDDNYTSPPAGRTLRAAQRGGKI